jgi:putative glutamine amidotransferase
MTVEAPKAERCTKTEIPQVTNKRPPIIGITCWDDQSIQDQHPPRFGQSQAYVHALAKAGAASVLIPPLTDKTLLRTIYDLLDGLLLASGEDVDPAYYGEPRHEKCGSVSPDRDKAELTLTGWAMDDGKPLLGICRGVQVLNVALGGTLYQDIQAQAQGADKHDRDPGYPRNRLSHTVIVTSQTRLAHILGSSNSARPLSLPVNSMHHQAIKDVASGLIVAARAPDKIVEAVEVEGHPFAIGVQWHPEELADNDVRSQRIFDALVEACQGRSERG